MRSFVLLSSCLLLVAAAPGQILKNINTVPQPTSSVPVDSSPGPFVRAGGRVYFAATGGLGRELYWADTTGASARLLADIEPGAAGSNPRQIVQLANGLVLFTATTSVHGEEVWVTDGTTAGTQLLLDISGPGESTMPAHLIAHQGHGYFLARPSGQFSLWLWRTDGTTAGTVPIESLGLTGSYSSAGQHLVSTGSWLFYMASQSVVTGSAITGEWRLHRSNGAPGGSQLVLQQAESTHFGPRELTAVGGRVVWNAQGIGTGLEPWVSDGTPGGTSIVELIPGSSGSNPTEFTVVGNHVYFAAYEAFVSGEVFVSDGTVSGTVQVTSATRQFMRPLNLRAAGNRCAYLTDDGVHGNELWMTGPTPGTETMVADLQPGPLGSDPSGLIAFGTGFVFTASLPATGTELFWTDGTPAGTSLLANIAPGSTSSNPGGFTVLGNRVFFAARTVQYGLEPWVTDGTTGGTQLHTDIAAPPADYSSYANKFVNLGDRAVFVADDGLTGNELWVTDGTTKGTFRLTDFLGSTGSISMGPWPMLAFDGRAFFALNDGVHGIEPWISDGTVAGTHMLADLGPGNSSPIPLLVWRGELYFAAGYGWYTWLWATDGTTAGTRLVSSAMSLAVTPPPVEHGGHLYFSGSTPSHGGELWRTDGTTAGTQMVVDLNPGTGSSTPALEAASFGGHLYFSAHAGTGDVEVWRTDGTVAGTTLFANVNSASSSWPYDYRVHGNRLAFGARVGTAYQYFSTDGVVVQQLTFPPLAINTNWRLGSTSDKLIAMMRGANYSFELWGTDGTVAGSGVIKQISPNSNEFVNMRSWRVSSGDKLLFAAADATVGSEIFVTDGTAAGTGVLFDLVAGPEDSHPEQVIRLGDKLLFGAWEPSTGFELYSLPFALVDDWVGRPFGNGCAGSSGTLPRLGTSGSATPGATLTVTVEQAPSLAPLLHYWSPDYTRLDVGGCVVVLATPTFASGSVTSTTGAGSLAIAVPNTPNLVGTDLWLQSMVLDAGGALLGFAAVAPALEVMVGN